MKNSKSVKASKATKAAKAAKVPARKVLSHEQRSAIARLAAFKAHTHKTFLKRNKTTLASAKANFSAALRKAPSAIRARFAA